MDLSQYRLTDQQIVGQNERTFNWSLREYTEFGRVIIADCRLSQFFPALKHWAKTTFKRGPTIEKLEAVPGKWELDQNFSTILVRWTTSEGTFSRELMWAPGTSYKYRLAPADA